MDRTVVVTGGSRGIGRAICTAFAKHKDNIVLNYAGNDEAALETKAICEKLGAKVEIIKADVADFEKSKEIIDFAVEKFGKLDVLVNNAGITRDNLIMRMKEEEFDSVIDVNLKGTFNLIKHSARIFTKQKSGRIINLTSVVGISGNAGQANYAASKAGIIGITKSCAKELASRNVTVNAVAPGFIETDMTGALNDSIKEEFKKTIPLQRFGKPEDIANTVEFLASKEAGYITGQVICVSGGMLI